MNALRSSVDPPTSDEKSSRIEGLNWAAPDEINWLFLFFSCLVMIGFMHSPGLRALTDSTAAFPIFMHWILESLTVIVAAIVFVASFWQETPFSGKRLLLAGGLLAVAGLDSVHQLVYPTNSQQAILLWLAGRGIEALCLLAVVASDAGTSVRRPGGLAIFALAVASALLVCYLILAQPQIWPLMFDPKNGLTNSKIYVEYAIISVFVVALIVTVLRADKIHFVNLPKLQTALFFSILCSLWFTIYPNVTSIYFFFGHIYKVLAYYFLLKAFYVPDMPRWFLLLIGTLAGKRYSFVRY